MHGGMGASWVGRPRGAIGSVCACSHLAYWRRLAERVRHLPADKLAQCLDFLKGLEVILEVCERRAKRSRCPHCGHPLTDKEP